MKIPLGKATKKAVKKPRQKVKVRVTSEMVVDIDSLMNHYDCPEKFEPYVKGELKWIDKVLVSYLKENFVEKKYADYSNILDLLYDCGLGEPDNVTELDITVLP